MDRLAIYKRLRSGMKTGDVVAFQGTDVFARLIQTKSKSPYSHVGLIIRIREVSIERVFILESVTKAGVVLLPLSRKLKAYKGKAWWIPLTLKKRTTDASPRAVDEGVRTVILRHTMEELGKGYDYRHIKAIVKRTLGITKKTPIEDYEEYICSELVGAALKESGILPKSVSTSLIEPKHITGLPILGRPRRLL